MRCAFLLLFSVAAWSSAEPAIPETPTGMVLGAWLKAFNSNDSVQVRAFWQKYSTDEPERRVANEQRLWKMTGGMALFQIVEDSGTHLVAVMKEGHGAYSETTIDLASANPPLIKNISGHPVPSPPDGGDRAGSAEELAEQVKSYASKVAAADRFSGAIVVVHNGRPVVRQAWGMADREKRINNSLDTQFCIGSMNKMFTAVAILQLVQQGKLSLDANLGEYLRDYPNRDVAARVKIRHLLSHTGGTGDIFTPEYESHRLELRDLRDYVKLYGDRPVEFEPGTRMEYSNYGFILLGRVIEVITDQPYEQYVQERVFAPAGMIHTDSRPEADRVSGRAVGYTRGPDGLRTNQLTLPWSGTSAGGGYSTVGDLVLFAGALQSGKLLSAALLKQATTDQTKTGYGFGFYTMREGMYGHGGGAPGMNGELRVIPATDYIIAVLANRDPSIASEIERFVEARI